MKEFLDGQPSVVIDPAEYVRLLGYPVGHKLQDRAKELAGMTHDWYAKHGKPWVYVRKAGTFDLFDDQFIIDRVSFQSKAVLQRFHKGKAVDVFLVAVSAGKECEERAQVLWKESKPDEYFFMEMYGSAVVENLIMQTSSKLCAWADESNLAILPHYSPGYNEWDIRDQLKLIELIKKGNRASDKLPVESLESGMLKPKKSLLAIFGVTRHSSKLTSYPGMIPCEKCALKGCAYRRKPYRFSKDNQQKTSTDRIIMNPEQIKIPNPTYSLSNKVLKKWSDERLTLSSLDENSIKATFIYDGTTCSNFGFPLQFEYTITLANDSGSYTITDMDCQPANGDIGYQKMCQYIRQGNDLLEKIRRENDLVGQSLDELFDQNVTFTPAGCYCDPESRSYKWNLVLQVLHFALNNN